MPLYYPPSSGSGTPIPGPKGDKGDPGTPSTIPGPKGDKGDPGTPSTIPGPKGDKGDPGTPALVDASITVYKNTATTTNATPVTVRTIAIAANSKLFINVVAQYVQTGNTACGFTIAQNEFCRGTGSVSNAGATDIKSVNGVNGTVLLTATATGVDIAVKGPGTATLNWWLRITSDIG